MAKKEKFIVTTPTVELGFGSLRTPDTKFNPEGDYKQDFFMSPEAAKAFVEKVESDPRMAAFGKKAKLKFTKVDGTIKFRTKQHAVVKNKAGEVFNVKPRLFYIVDGKTVEYPEDAPNPWSGTKAEIEVELVPYDGFGGGVTMRLRAVRFLEIVEGKKKTGNWSEVPEDYTSPAVARVEAPTEADFDDDAEGDDDDDDVRF